MVGQVSLGEYTKSKKSEQGTIGISGKIKNDINDAVVIDLIKDQNTDEKYEGK